MAAHRENNFDAIRLIAAAAVIYGHAHPLTGTPDVGFMGNSVQSFAVKTFFVISGFLITASWVSDANPLHYLEKRALRIFPALTVVVLLCALVLGPLVTTLPLGEYLANGRLRTYFENIILRPSYDLPGVFGSLPYPMAVNGSLWSLPVEFGMYLVLPVLAFLAWKLRLRALVFLGTVGLCALSLYATRTPGYSHDAVFYGTRLSTALDAAPYFLLGSCYRFYGLERTLSPVVALGGTGLVLLVQPSGMLLNELTLYLLAPYAILAFALHPHPLFARAGRFGDFSYGLYLFGFPVQQAANFFSHRPLTALQNTMISLPVALALAFASWHLVEKRALALKPRGQVPLTPVAAPEPTT